MNVQLRDVITADGWTYESLARAVVRVAAENGEVLRTNKSAIAHWVDGTMPGRRTAGYLAEALSRRVGRPVTLTQIGMGAPDGPALSGADLVDTAEALGRADVEHRGFLAAAAFTVANVALPLGYEHEAVLRMFAARSGMVAGEQEVKVIHQITTVFAAADEVLGGGHGLSTVSAYLADTAAPMLRGRFASEQVRRQAFGAAAELAWLAGFKHHDLGHEGAAQRYYLLGFQLACEADPAAHAAWMMRTIAHQALSLKQPRFCVDVVEAAIARSHGVLDSATAALLHITHARAFAAIGEKTRAARALLAAEITLGRDGGQEQPGYSALAGPAVGAVDSHTARTLTELGDHTGTENRHRAALISWDPEKYKRVHMLTHADLGDCLVAQARADEAVAAWTQALDLAEGMASERSAEALASARTTLATYRRRGVPGAAELEHRIRETLIKRTAIRR